MSPRTITRLTISAVVLLLFLLHSTGWLPLRLLDQLERFTYDSRLQLTLPKTVDPKIVIVDIDERSLLEEGQWPWSRRKLADMVTQLFDRYGIRALGFDIVFSEPDRSSGLELLDQLAGQQLADLPGFAARVQALRSELDNDRAFAAAVEGRPVVWGYYFSQRAPNPGQGAVGTLCRPVIDAGAAKLFDLPWLQPGSYTGSLAVLQAASPYCGFFDNPTLDEDGVYRRVPLLQQYQGALYESLALALARVAVGAPAVELDFDPPELRTALHIEQLRAGPLRAPVDHQVAVLVPYRGPEGSFPYVSAADVLSGRADPVVLKDRIVIVGTSAPGLRDLRVTPVGKAYSGVEVHANIVSGLLEHRIKQQAPYYRGIEVVMLLLIGGLIAWAFARLSPLGAAGLGLGLLALLSALALVFWHHGHFVLPFGVPVAYTIALYLAHLLYGYFVESRRARGIARQFGQYVPPEIVAEMAEKSAEISMEGESREMTVLFSDVRGFTGISEKLDARELSTLMNLFLTKQTGVIQRHRGTIDKYMGDAIMAFWGAPLPDPEHGRHALEAGLEMVAAVRELDAEFDRRGWPRLHIGVGLNTGKMHVGNMGSEFRVAYTVMGDAVNLGSRLESLTKEYGVAILCSEYTRNTAPSDWAFRELDRVVVKGKLEPVAIYEPLGPKEQLDPALRNDLARHRGALRLYRSQQWEQAEAEFFSLSRSGRPHRVYELFLERIAYLRQHPPGGDWNGAYTFSYK